MRESRLIDLDKDLATECINSADVGAAMETI